MSLLYPDDTLGHHMARPLVHARSIADARCNAIAACFKDFTSGLPMATPEVDALEFYQLNHAMSLISQKRLPAEPLPEKELLLVKRYFETAGPAALRAFYYLLITCTREARHLHEKTMWVAKLSAQFGAPVGQYFNKLPGDAEEAMAKFCSSPPDCDLGSYVKALQAVFYHGQWSGGYGGKAWGAVCDCLVNFVVGTTSLEVMLDTVWTLCHNNGPIFNKGMLYKMYSDEYLVRILDVQRAGMVPTMIKTLDNLHPTFVTPAIQEVNEIMFGLFELPDKLDHAKIMELGATLSWGGLPKPKTKKKTMADLLSEASPTPKLTPFWQPYPGANPYPILARAA